jgi:hypothetical protein
MRCIVRSQLMDCVSLGCICVWSCLFECVCKAIASQFLSNYITDIIEMFWYGFAVFSFPHDAWLISHSLHIYNPIYTITPSSQFGSTSLTTKQYFWTKYTNSVIRRSSWEAEQRNRWAEKLNVVIWFLFFLASFERFASSIFLFLISFNYTLYFLLLFIAFALLCNAFS